jgi:hypothetical protein
MVALPVDLDGRDIAIETRAFVAQRFARCGDKESMQLLCKRGEILHGLASFSTLSQKVLELVHGVGIPGQQVTVLPCLQRGSPLA